MNNADSTYHQQDQSRQKQREKKTNKSLTGIKRLSVKILWMLKMIEKYYEQLNVNAFTILLNRVIPWKTQVSKLVKSYTYNLLKSK